MKAFWCIALVFLCLSLYAQFAESKVQSGHVSTSSDWKFVSKFCFSKGIGNFTWSILSEDTSRLKLVFYDDVEDSWPLVWKNRNKWSCAEKVLKAKGNHSIINNKTHLQEFSDDVRPHFWYFVVSNCNNSKPINLKYHFQWLNKGGAWTRQFSFDEQGLPAMYLVFWLFFMILTAVHLWGVVILVRNGSYHPLVRILTACIVLELFSLFFLFIHYAEYANNGRGSPGLKEFAEFVDLAAQLLFIFLLILIAKGWAISKNEITDKYIIIGTMAILSILYLSMFIWDQVGRSAASSVYIYDAGAGISLLVFRTLAMFWFIFCVFQTTREETNPNKRLFYFVFAAAFSIWFIMLPFIAIIASAIAAWDRFKIVQALYLLMNFLGFSAIAFLLWPSRVAEYFEISKTDLLLGGGAAPKYKATPYETL